MPKITHSIHHIRSPYYLDGEEPTKSETITKQVENVPVDQGPRIVAIREPTQPVE